MHASHFPPFFHQVQHFSSLFPIPELFFRFSALFFWEKRWLFFLEKKKLMAFYPKMRIFPPRLVYFKERSRLVSSLGFFFFTEVQISEEFVVDVEPLRFLLGGSAQIGERLLSFIFEGFWVYKDARFGVGSVCLFVRNRPSNFVFEWFWFWWLVLAGLKSFNLCWFCGCCL